MKAKYYIGLALVIAATLIILTLGYTSILNKPGDPVTFAVVDKKVGDFQTTTLEEAAFTQNDLPKGTVVVEVFASWCIPCRESFKEIAKFEKENKNEEVQVIGLAYEDVGFEVKKFMKDYGTLNKVVMSNVSIKNALDLRSVPQTLIIQDGEIKLRVYGSLKIKDLKEAIKLVQK